MASATLGGVYRVSSEGASMLADLAESSGSSRRTFDSRRADDARLSVLSDRVKETSEARKTR